MKSAKANAGLYTVCMTNTQMEGGLKEVRKEELNEAKFEGGIG